MSNSEEWTRESEAAALAALRRAAAGDGPKPIVLAYTRHFERDLGKHRRQIGSEHRRQLDSIMCLPELQGLPLEHYEESGQTMSNRPTYAALIHRIRTAPVGAIGAVAFSDQDRLLRNFVKFALFMREMAERHILVFDRNGLVSNIGKLPRLSAFIAQQERREELRGRAAMRSDARPDIRRS